ncbi:MAG: glycoside hydrolase family 3 C-terminal domain-containing protein, partial [Flammeovirgaceae bacterium]|nr:glycoside hydrolase family 3 C-terminal domain-containing protein [Flammeovirgaceae bacterium]
KQDIKSLVVLGPNATNGDVLLGNYYGVTPNMTTILEGIAQNMHPGTSMEYKHAFLLDRENINPIDWSTDDAHKTDAIIVSMGLSGLLEGEEGEALASPTKSDRFDISLPENQLNYLKKLKSKGDKPIILILSGGSPVAIPEVHDIVDAVIYAWYPGEAGGEAISNIIFGKTSPSGRLPITFPKSVDQLPPYEDYAMVGRTYRYMEEEPQYPFGFGLTYGKFTYSAIKLDNEKVKAGTSVKASVTVTNSSELESEEVVQLYITDLEASTRTPLYALKGFKRIKLAPGKSQTVEFEITEADMMLVDDEGKSKIEKGEFKITIGGSSPGKRSEELGAPKALEAVFTVK